jgi:hypothetical protein
VFAETETQSTCQAMTSDDSLSLIYLQKAIRDIHSLYTRDFTTIYLPGHEPVKGTYPVAYCQLKIRRISSTAVKKDILDINEKVVVSSQNEPTTSIYTSAAGASQQLDVAAVRSIVLPSMFRVSPRRLNFLRTDKCRLLSYGNIL